MHRTHPFLQFTMVSPFCGTLWGERQMNFLHIRDMFFPNTYISLQPTHPNISYELRVVTFSESITSIHGKLWERLVYLWSTVGGIKKKYEPTTNTIWMILSHFFILSLYTRIHGYSQKCMKTSASCGVELSPLNLNYEVQWSLCTCSL